jgi:hypothetical protein
MRDESSAAVGSYPNLHTVHMAELESAVSERAYDVPRCSPAALLRSCLPTAQEAQQPEQHDRPEEGEDERTNDPKRVTEDEPS